MTLEQKKQYIFYTLKTRSRVSVLASCLKEAEEILEDFGVALDKVTLGHTVD